MEWTPTWTTVEERKEIYRGRGLRSSFFPLQSVFSLAPLLSQRLLSKFSHSNPVIRGATRNQKQDTHSKGASPPVLARRRGGQRHQPSLSPPMPAAVATTRAAGGRTRLPFSLETKGVILYVLGQRFPRETEEEERERESGQNAKDEVASSLLVAPPTSRRMVFFYSSKERVEQQGERKSSLLHSSPTPLAKKRKK